MDVWLEGEKIPFVFQTVLYSNVVGEICEEWEDNIGLLDCDFWNAADWMSDWCCEH